VTAHARTDVWRDDLRLWLDATEKAPQNPRAWLNAGHAALARGDLPRARGLLLEAHRLSPCYAYIQLNLSAVEAREGHAPASLAWADEAVRCNPGLALARAERAGALERLGRADEALAEYRATTAIDAVNAGAWLAQGRLLEARGDWPDAAHAFDRALAADPTSSDAAMRAALVYHYRLGDLATAVDRYRTVLAIDPNHYGAHYQVAVALLGTGRKDEALAAWRRFVPLADALGDRTSIDGAPPELRTAAR
jgi:tetratricopeptide (TPR) repeat protein